MEYFSQVMKEKKICLDSKQGWNADLSQRVWYVHPSESGVWSDEIWLQLRIGFYLEKNAASMFWSFFFYMGTHLPLYRLHVTLCCTSSHDPITIKWRFKWHVSCDGMKTVSTTLDTFFIICMKTNWVHICLFGSWCRWAKMGYNSEIQQVASEKCFLWALPETDVRNKLHAFHMINSSALAVTSVVNEGRV